MYRRLQCIIEASSKTNVKKYKPHSGKKVVEDLENVLKRDFTTTYINEKWVGDITYIHTSRDSWCYLASVLDLHSKKIIGYAFGKRMTNNLVIKALKKCLITIKILIKISI